jgi:hypothetical protein
MKKRKGKRVKRVPCEGVMMDDDASLPPSLLAQFSDVTSNMTRRHELTNVAPFAGIFQQYSAWIPMLTT